MNPIGKILAGVFAFFFVISGVIALLAFNIERKAFSPETYKQAFEKQNLYDRMPAILGTALSTSIAENANVTPFLKVLSPSDWETSITSLLPPEELQALTNQALDSTFDYINGKTDSVAISTLPFKAHLVSGSGMDIVKQILRSQPDCTAEQLLQLGMGLFGGDISLCNPPEEMMGLVTPLIELQYQVMIAAIPDEVTLVSTGQSNTPGDSREQLNRIRLIMKTTPVFPVLFLFGITIFAVRSLVDWLKWWGIPFLVTGAGSSVIASIGSPAIALIAQNILQNRGPGLVPPILFSAFREAVSAAISQILRLAVIEGLILAAIGLGMVITAIYLMKRTTSQARAGSGG